MPLFQQVWLSGSGKNKMHKNFISSVLILLPFLIVTIATSSYKYVPIIRTYSVSSNCSNATLTSGTITATDSTITSPANTTYLSIGLPLANLIVGGAATISAEIAPALTRTCLHSLVAVGSATNSVYTCADNSIPSCVVTLTPVQ